MRNLLSACTTRAAPHAAALALLAATLAAHPVRAAPDAELWPYWQTSDPSSSRVVDHSPWQRLLDTYLITTDDGRTLFRYDAVSEADRRALADYVSALAGEDPRALSRPEQLPYWINFYNALTVQVVLAHPEARSIRTMGGGWFSSGPWNDELVTIAGRQLSLNDIEHRILRPIWDDHHIHYGVNCASVSCPNLAAEAYTAANARRLLEDGERHYLSHPRGLRFDPQGVLHLSSIFDWYRADFGGSREALLEYLAGERPALAERLRDYRGRIAYEYDWALNEAPRTR